MAPGNKGKHRRKYAMDNYPEEKGIEEHHKAYTGKSNCRNQEGEKAGNREPENFCPGKGFWFFCERIKRRKCLRMLDIIIDALPVSGADYGKDTPFRPLSFEENKLVRNEGITF